MSIINIDILTDAISQTKNFENILKYIITIESADTQKLVKTLIQIGDIEYICCIAEYDVDKSEYLETILNSSKMKKIKKSAKLHFFC